MKTFLRAIVALAGFASVAQASDTTIKYEVSTDGLHWSSSLNALPGTQIQVRTRVIWSGATPVYGFDQISFQPVVSSWTPADHLETTAGTPHNPNNAQNPSGNGPGGVGILGGAGTTPSANVPDLPGIWGRVSPFAFIATNTSTYLRGFLGTGTAAGLLRIAQAQATNWIGVGPTSGSPGGNNWNARNGVTAGQLTPGRESRPGGLAFLPGTDNVVFKFGFTLSTSDASRTLEITTPLEGISKETTPGPNYGRVVSYWALSPSDILLNPFYDSTSAEAAAVHVIPAPNVIVLAGFAAGLFARRRLRPAQTLRKA